MRTEARAGAGRIGTSRDVEPGCRCHVFLKTASRGRSFSHTSTAAIAVFIPRSGSRAIGSDRGQIAVCRGRVIPDATA